MPSKAKASFDQNKKDVDELWRIHEEVSGAGAGRKHGVDVINRSAIVFITACWESFVEDLATEAFEFMLANSPTAEKIPGKVKDLATKPFFEQQNTQKIWEIADSGWRKVLQTHQDTTLKEWLGTFHTPKSPNIKTLYKELLGLNDISQSWHWHGMSVENAATKLDSYVTIRGNIAHRTEHDETVYKDWITDYLGHVERLVEKSEVAVHTHLQAITGKSAW